MLKKIRNFINQVNDKIYSPVIVYTMGKVGSSTVINTIKDSGLKSNVYQVHFISPSGIESAKELFYNNNHYVPEHLDTGEYIYKMINSGENNTFKIITLVRDPVGRDISDFFQNMKLFMNQDISDPGQISEDNILEGLNENFSKFDAKQNYAANWFTRELEQGIDINVYDSPYDSHTGYQIIKKKNIELLIIRLEDFDRFLPGIISNFLLLDEELKLKALNAGLNKEYAPQYKNILARIKLPADILTEIYSTRYARHFYNDEEIKRFIDRWS